jgi:hypothetical protein
VSSFSGEHYTLSNNRRGETLRVKTKALILQFEPPVQARAWTPSWISTRKSFSRLYSSGAMNSMRIFSALPGR